MAKILFAQEMFFPLQSTQALSAFLKRGGHSTDIAIGSPGEIVEYAKRTNPDLIGFSVLTAYRNHMLATASLLKESGVKIPIIAGGYDITFMPQILPNSDLDMICVGEGGDPIVELADALESGKDYRDLAIQNLHIKRADGSIKENEMRNWSMELDDAPFDDRDIYWNKDPYFKIIPFTQVLAGRCCPYPCTYCFNEGYKQIHVAAGMKASEYTHFRSVDHVIAELKILSEKYNARYFFFNDSTLTYNKKWILEFCDKYKSSGLKQNFSLNAVIPELTEEVCQALADTGKCQLIRFGLETGNEEFRIKTLRKSIRNKKMIQGTEILNRHGLRYSMQMMLGLPGETYEFAWETIEMARKLTGDSGVHGINIFKPFPGLEINNIGLELGEYQATDVIAPGSIPPPTWRKESFDNIASASEGIALPEDEAYLTSRSDMRSSGGSTDTLELPIAATSVEEKEPTVSSRFGTTEMVFYDNYRRDALGVKILKLSRYSHLAIRFPGIRPIVEKIIELPDNAFNRLVWKLTEGFLNIRVHAAAPLSYMANSSLKCNS
jgi:anaerobic magnesium-protoporphyrin IX monomethyl ester cyclase